MHLIMKKLNIFLNQTVLHVTLNKKRTNVRCHLIFPIKVKTNLISCINFNDICLTFGKSSTLQKMDCHHVKNVQTKQAINCIRLQYFFFFFLPCLSLLIYVSEFCRTQFITQKFLIFKSKTVDYIRHEGLDQHCLVDIYCRDFLDSRFLKC